MNVNSVFTNRPASRAESSPRSDSTSRTDRASRNDEVERIEDGTEVRKPRKPSPREFSALLALLAGAGPQVRAELLTQVPTDRASLIDSLLDGTSDLTAADGATEPVPADATGQAPSQRADDALRLGILNEHGANGIATALRAITSNGARSSDNHAQEVLSRIAARNAATADQLKARGDNEAADLRMALDALLAKAGTPSGLELAAAADNTSTTNAALAAAAAALATAKSASSADVTTPVRDTAALAPELQTRLDKVIARMRDEYGHDVQVVETARSQERQDFLYEQGRTRPGAVVTWTRDSAHTQGAAVDVMVDGSWKNGEGFARLQQIAREEGLRTLGARDPGHLELESGALVGARTGVARDDSAPRPQSAVASAAGQAGIAQVAGVATVAAVAQPGASRGFSRSVNRTESIPASVVETAGASAATAPAPASAGNQGNAFGRGPRDEDGRPLNDGRGLRTGRRETLGAAETVAFGALQGTATPAAAATSDAPTPATGIGSAERVADLQALRDNVPAGSVSRLTLNIDGAERRPGPHHGRPARQQRGHADQHRCRQRRAAAHAHGRTAGRAGPPWSRERERARLRRGARGVSRAARGRQSVSATPCVSARHRTRQPMTAC